jgi:hypothetical protein
MRLILVLLLVMVVIHPSSRMALDEQRLRGEARVFEPLLIVVKSSEEFPTIPLFLVVDLLRI